jgi:hypothetical protein
MGAKGNSTDKHLAGEVFRQFAWHLAGTLAKPVRRAAKPRPAAGQKP